MPMYIVISDGGPMGMDLELMSNRPSGPLSDRQRVFAANINGGDSIEITEEINEAHAKPWSMGREQWSFLAQAEMPLYDANHGAHAFTSVWHYGDEQAMRIVSPLWEQAYLSIEAEAEGDPGRDLLSIRTAARVARALALLAFGPEFIIR